MTDSSLEDRVVDFITERGGGVSFVELESEFPEEFEGQEHAMCFADYENIILWHPVSPAMIGALTSASNNGRIMMKPAPQIVYLVDGKFLKIPLARKLHHYKTLRWLPVTFGLGKSGTRKGDET